MFEQQNDWICINDDELITHPTRVAETSASLIYNIVTNKIISNGDI